MVLNLVVIVVIALLGWVWLTRGFFSAFLNLVACVLAGAIAFGVWEPLAYFLLTKLDGNSAWGGTVWAVSLAIPFAVSMALLRAGLDAACPSNMKFSTAVDSVGGGVCGALSGLIASGIILLSGAFLRLETSFGGYEPVGQQPNGSLRTDAGLWVPADRLTAAFYKTASNGSLSTATPLAKYYPDLEYVPYAMRISFGDGKARNTIALKDFDVWRRFTVGDKNSSLADALKDDWNPTVSQNVTDINESPYPAGTVLHGFVLNFQPSARERSGSVVLGNAQLRLLLENTARKGDYRTVYPVSVICQAKPDKRAFARFRFDAPNTYVSSTGGSAEARMGFEFPVPPGYEPIALYVKNTRVELPESKKPVAYSSAQDRDARIRNGSIFDIPAEEDSITSNRATRPAVQSQNQDARDLGILIGPQLGFIMQRGTERGLTTEDEAVVEGQETYEIAMFRNTRGIERSLQINKFLERPDTVIVQFSAEAGKPMTWLGKVGVDKGTPAPTLVDTDGQTYEPVGYIYDEQDKLRTVRFNRGQPMRTMDDLPSMSTSRQDQKLTLIYDVSKGVKLDKLVVGTTVIHQFKPALPTVNR
ncbi:MAG TPA: CvpA family protein [Phycisphaerales bacterium]|nr:CvpA family protein [Phycisphaerales bacterium]